MNFRLLSFFRREESTESSPVVFNNGLKEGHIYVSIFFTTGLFIYKLNWSVSILSLST